jgi:fumarate hydratase subunit alpha
MKPLDLHRVIEEMGFQLIKKSVIEIPLDVKEALKNAYRKEDMEAGKIQLKAIIEDIRLAEDLNVPVCQDTGLIIFYVTMGRTSLSLAEIREGLTSATRRATEEVPLRSNAVHPLSRKNNNDNTGWGIPYIEWDGSENDHLEITAFPKGAGSENKSALKNLLPSDGIPEIKKFVIDSVMKAGGGPCPPSIIGVGIGGSSDLALKLAKKALLRPLNTHHQDPEIADLERELLGGINLTGIGPMGLGGSTTSLGVNIEYAYCHIASLPVAINMQCWAARKATARLYGDGRVIYL